MLRDQQDVLLFGQTQQLTPNQRAGGKIKRLAGFGFAPPKSLKGEQPPC
jgi:hypothetical protein